MADSPSRREFIWDAFEAIKFWNTLEELGREEWPWRMFVIDPEKLATLFDADIPAVRVRVLLKSMSAAAFEASKAESRDFVRFMSPPYAPEPGGKWREGEKAFVRNVVKLVGAQHHAFCEVFRIPFPQNLGRSFWALPQLSHNPWEALIELLNILNAKCATAWEVPFEQWPQAQHDFELCRCFEPVQTLHALADEQGRIRYPPVAEYKTINALALHNPTKDRQTPAKSVAAWQAMWIWSLFISVYGSHRARVDKRWNWKDPNPFRRLELHPSKTNTAEALNAARATRKGEARTCDVSGQAIPTDLSTDGIRDGLQSILKCVSIAAGIATNLDFKSLEAAGAKIFEDAGVLSASLRDIDGFVRQTTGTRPYEWTEAMLDEIQKVRHLAPSLQAPDSNTRAFISEKLLPILESLATREALLRSLALINRAKASNETDTDDRQTDTPKKKQKRQTVRMLDGHARECIRRFKAYVRGGEPQTMKFVVEEYESENPTVSANGLYRKLNDNSQHWKKPTRNRHETDRHEKQS